MRPARPASSPVSVYRAGSPADQRARRAGNLPAELSSFIGRRRELAEVRRLLSASHLVTLTGVGGAGKTRLALRAAADVRRAFPDGVFFVDLTEVRTPRLGQDSPDALAFLVMTALGLRQQGGGPPVRQLTAYLDGRQALLVLDNCEHLVRAAAALADALVRGCSRLRLLATSREPLTIGGEVLYPVPPLSTPPPDRRVSPTELATVESVALFVARARAAAPDFVLTDDRAEAVAELCRRLDGLPLAIELAAARSRALAPSQILARLTDRFGLLSCGGRTTAPRQRTLRGSVAWSYDLCSKAERMLWARLSVFPGAFELDAVEGVCADEVLPTEDILDAMAGLVDKSLVESVAVDGVVRYTMLETIREYGQQQLVEPGEQAALRRRHRDWYRRLAEQARDEWVSDRQVHWFARLPREHPHLRAAMEFCLTEPGEAEAALEILAALPRLFWWGGAITSEGRGWLRRALARTDAPTRVRGNALLLAAMLGVPQGDSAAAAAPLAAAADLAQRLDDPFLVGMVAEVRSQIALRANDLTAAVRFGEQGLRMVGGESPRELLLRLRLLLQVAVAAGLAGDEDRAVRCYEAVRAITVPRGESCFRSYATWGSALAAWRAGNLAVAGQLLREGLRVAKAADLPYPYCTELNIELLAWVAAGQRQYRRAAILLGAADFQGRARGQPMSTMPMLRGDHDACERQCRVALGDAAFAEAFRQGNLLPYAEAFAYALRDRREPARPRAEASDTPMPLTRREREVAELIVHGLSNREIAARLVISPRTAESHVEHILTKLGFTSRAQVAAWVTAQRPDDQD